MSKMDTATLELLLSKINVDDLSADDAEKINALKSEHEKEKVELERIIKRKELQMKVEGNLDNLKHIVKGFDIPTSVLSIKRVWNLNMDSLRFNHDDMHMELAGDDTSPEFREYVSVVNDFILSRSDKMKKEWNDHQAANDVDPERIAEIGRQIEGAAMYEEISNALGLGVADNFLTGVDDKVVKNEARGTVTAEYKKLTATDTGWTFSCFFGKKSMGRTSSGSSTRISVTTVSDKYSSNKEYLEAMAYGTESPHYNENFTKIVDSGKAYNAKQWLEKIEPNMPADERLYEIASNQKVVKEIDTESTKTETKE